MAKVYIAGHLGMVGQAITKKLQLRADAGENIEIIVRSRKELDLTNQLEVEKFMNIVQPDIVILAAAKVGGIHANNTFPANFIYENIMIECNMIHQSFRVGVKKLLQLGSSCIYPKNTKQPIPENALLSGYLEPTNEPYAVAKIAGIKLCESYNRQYGCDFRSVMPTNLYGAGDNFDLQNSHVVPALIRRIHEAKYSNADEVTIWGTGKPKREFLHVDDMADASIFVLNLPKEVYETHVTPMCSHINVGSGHDISIFELASKIAHIVGYSGKIVTDESKPDGTMRKLLSNVKIRGLGWNPMIDLDSGLKATYAWYLENEH